MNVQDAIKYGQMVQEAERVGEGDPATYAPPFGYTVIQPIYANDLKTDMTPLGNGYVPFGFVARSPGPNNEFVVAIRGTGSIWEWIQDASFLKISCPVLTGSGDSEDGFTNLYSKLRTGPADGAAKLVDYLRGIILGTANATVTICGHSLGAAISTLLSLDLAGDVGVQPTVFTYASPNVGDSLFAATYNRLVPNTWRIVDIPDAIPHLPPTLLLGYEPVGTEFGLTPWQNVKVDLLCYHHLRTYLYLLGKIVGAPGFALDPECQP